MKLDVAFERRALVPKVAKVHILIPVCKGVHMGGGGGGGGGAPPQIFHHNQGLIELWLEKPWTWYNTSFLQKEGQATLYFNLS